ncbi:MAG: hypothetical protein KDK78_01055, partial [Chlamydiia bacterium]|nr:hypothetical protein [Chlamydiia bacterium]
DAATAPTRTDFTIQDMSLSQTFLTALRIPQLMMPQAVLNPSGIFQRLAKFVENLLRKLTGSVERAATSEDTEANEAETSNKDRARTILDLAKQLGLDLSEEGEISKEERSDQAARVMDWALTLKLDLALADEIAACSDEHPAFVVTGDPTEEERAALLETLTYTIFLMRDSYLTGENAVDPAQYGLGHQNS